MSVPVFLYFISVLVLCVYGAHRSSMVWQLLQSPYKDPVLPVQTKFPLVCVQIPLYNEAAVAKRVIEAVAGLSYPRGRFEIQVLDDSTDSTCCIVDSVVENLQRQGLSIQVIRRSERREFKAGALKAGIELSRAQFFAVFDADFVPPPDFLLKTIPYFQNPIIGFVQTRWGYLNRTQSFLTRAQAVLIDGHFLIEHAARAQHGFFNFNGTAGVWRRSAIDSAGGWQGDTVTEDLDLSYRAFLNGWQAIYLKDLVCLSELPDSISAFKSQQYRWMKGAAQVCRKILPDILSSSWSIRQKREAFFHLTANFCYILMVITGVLLVPVAYIRSNMLLSIGLWFELIIFLSTMGSLCFFYRFSQRVQGRPTAMMDILSAVVFGVGIGAHCACASIAGITRWSGEFVRTPKQGSGLVCKNTQPFSAIDFRSLFLHKKELCMVLYLFVGVVYLATCFLWLTIPFVLLILSGYASVLCSAVRVGKSETSFGETTVPSN